MLYIQGCILRVCRWFSCGMHGLHCKFTSADIEHFRTCDGAGSSGLQQKERPIPAESMEAVRGRAMWELGKLIRPSSGADSGEAPPIMVLQTVISHIASAMSPTLHRDPEMHGRQGHFTQQSNHW